MVIYSVFFPEYIVILVMSKPNEYSTLIPKCVYYDDSEVNLELKQLLF